MRLSEIVEQLVEERSLDALERLTGSKNEDVLEALVEAAGQLVGAEQFDDTEDRMVETIRRHLVDAKAVGILGDSLKHRDAATREFALACLSEIGDTSAVPAMISLLTHEDEGTKEAAAEHLALLTHYDFGREPAKWKEWYGRLVQGRQEQAVEDREDQERLLRLQLRGKRVEDAETEGEVPSAEDFHDWS